MVSSLLDAGTSHEFVLFVDELTRADGRWPVPTEAQYVVVRTMAPPPDAATASGHRSLRDLWAMSAAVARTPLDVLFYPSVFTYFPAPTRARVLVGVHDVIADDHPALVFPAWRGRLFWRIKAWLAHRQAGRIVTVSEYAKEKIVSRFGYRPEKVWVVGEAPDPAFQPAAADAESAARALARHGLSDTRRFIACLGGVNPHKNLGMLFEVVAELRRDPEFADLQIILIGPLESDTFTPGARAARQWAAQPSLVGAVHFTGYLPDAEVACLLSAAHVLVLPSVEEGFGLSAVEAAACGTPVVATRNSPLPQLLEGGGLFIDPTRPEEMRQALTTLLRDEARRRQMGQVALERARRLTWQSAAAQFLTLLSSLSVSQSESRPGCQT